MYIVYEGEKCNRLCLVVESFQADPARGDVCRNLHRDEESVNDPKVDKRQRYCARRALLGTSMLVLSCAERDHDPNAFVLIRVWIQTQIPGLHYMGHNCSDWGVPILTGTARERDGNPSQNISPQTAPPMLYHHVC